MNALGSQLSFLANKPDAPTLNQIGQELTQLLLSQTEEVTALARKAIAEHILTTQVNRNIQRRDLEDPQHPVTQKIEGFLKSFQEDRLVDLQLELSSLLQVEGFSFL